MNGNYFHQAPEKPR